MYGTGQLMQEDVATQADLGLTAGAGDFGRGLQPSLGSGREHEVLAGVNLRIWSAGFLDQLIGQLLPLSILRQI